MRSCNMLCELRKKEKCSGKTGCGVSLQMMFDIHKTYFYKSYLFLWAHVYYSAYGLYLTD